MNETSVPSNMPPEKTDEPALWFILCGKRLLVNKGEVSLTIPLLTNVNELGFNPLRQFYLGTYRGRHCYAVEIDDKIPIPNNMEPRGIRGMFNHLDEELFKITLRAYHLIDWDRNYQFCVRCGTKTINKDNERAKRCTACGNISFIRISPAVIVMVTKGDQILLARAHYFDHNMYSVLAGFVEPGETLEDTVKREIKEEVGISVKDISYFGSQPWPFPDSLMIAFTAKHAEGDIRIDKTEIADAQWFNCKKLPVIPGKISIARKMIDWFIEKTENNE